MPLTGKYLKYSPEITPEILTLVQDKLKLCGMNSLSAKENYNYFKKGYEYLVGTQKNFFYTREKNSPDLLNKSETTVQEILEYDPFVKKEVIPKYVELLEGFDSTCTGKIFDTNQPIPQMSGWSNQWTWESIFKNDTQRSYFKSSTKEAFDAQNKPIEKWSVGSYVVFLEDCVNSTSAKKGDINLIIDECHADNLTQKKPKQMLTFRSYSEITHIKWFATKSEAEEFAKTLVGSVKHDNSIIDAIELKEFPKEGHCKTDNVELRNYLFKRPSSRTTLESEWIEGKSIGVGWNEYSYWVISEKSSRPEYQLSQLQKFFTKDEVKQQLKQAVHCTTQEEWDFANDIHQSSLKADFKDFKDKTVLRLDFKNAYADVLWAETNGYQILSFQEWCDLNGYKMEKEFKFEVGKWYKCKNHNYAIKYLREKACDFKHVIVYSDIIDDYKNYKSYSEGKTGVGYTDGIGWYELKDLSEIQQYLPDDHPDKIKNNREFKAGDYVLAIGNIREYEKPTIGQVIKFNYGNSYNSRVNFSCNSNCIIWSNIIRHATPEEIYNHSSFIGQIQSEKYPFKKLEEDDLTWEIKTEGIRWTEPVPITKDNWKHEMLLSVDDEEFPMVNIIKTNTIKQLLNND